MTSSIGLRIVFITAAISIPLCIVALICYRIAYQKRINKALERGESQAHRKMVDASSVARSCTIIMVICMFLSMSVQIGSLRDSMNSSINMMSDQIASLQFELTQARTEQNSNILNFEEVSAEYNPNKQIVQVTMKAELKTVSEDTKVEVLIGDHRVEMKRDGNVFLGTVEFGIFEGGLEAKLVMTSNGITTTENTNYGFGNYYTCVLPVFTKSLIMNSGTKWSQKQKGMKIDGEIILEPFVGGAEPSNIDITSAEIVFSVNGTAVKQNDITGKLTNDIGYQGEFHEKIEGGEHDTYDISLHYVDENGYAYDDNLASICEGRTEFSHIPNQITITAPDGTICMDGSQWKQ